MGARFLRGGLYVGAAHWFTYVINFAVTLTVSRFTPPPPLEVQALVEEIRLPSD